MSNPDELFSQQSVKDLEKKRKKGVSSPLKPAEGVIISLCTDSTGNVIDLLRDPLPEPQLSEEDRQKNLELLEQAKKVSDRFLSRRGRRSTSSLTESPTGAETHMYSTE